MDTNLLAALIGVFAGALGYWFATFCMQPILRYRDIRNNILMDFIYFAQVINAEGLNDEMKKLHRERVLSNRKTSAQLTAAIQDLPKWYLKFLKWKKYNPNEAANHLIGYSNTTEYEMSHKLEAAIRKRLGLPYEEI
jgi:hypothetical protein